MKYYQASAEAAFSRAFELFGKGFTVKLGQDQGKGWFVQITGEALV